MITILRLSPKNEWFADHHAVGLHDGFARAVATTDPGGLTFVFDRESDRICRIDTSHRRDFFADEARAFHLIWLYDRLTDGEPMYMFTLRPLARERVLALVDKRWPMGSIVEAAE